MDTRGRRTRPSAEVAALVRDFQSLPVKTPVRLIRTRFHAQQVSRKKVLHAPPRIRQLQYAVPYAGRDEQLKILARLNKTVHYLIGACGVYVAIHFPYH